MRSLKLFWCLFSVAQAACSDTTTAQDVLADRDLTGQVHVITGGDSGIGFAAAKALAAKNATVVLGCRGTTGKYAEAVANISKATGNSKVSVLVLDLSSFSSVRNFAVQLIKQFPRIDALQCNAGIEQNPDFLPPHTEDGFERTFQVNYLGHLLLVGTGVSLAESQQRPRGDHSFSGVVRPLRLGRVPFQLHSSVRACCRSRPWHF